jgi:Tol biopolymer transport system component
MRSRRATLLFAASALLLVVGLWGSCKATGSGAAAGPGGDRPPEVPGLFVYECTDEGREDEDLCVVPVAGGTERRLTQGFAADLSPRFMPDGGRVLFSSNRSGEYQLWMVSAAEGAATRVRASNAREWQSDPGPDGKKIVLLSNADGVQTLRSWSFEGEMRTIVERKRRVTLGNPHWSRDGTRVVFSSNEKGLGHHVYVVEVHSGEVRRVSSLVSGACEPRFSPDGTRIVHVRRSHLSPEKSAIVEQELATGKERVLVDWPVLNYDPVYSPDQSEIAFASTLPGRYAIYRLRLSDGKAWRVTFGASARHPDYQPTVTEKAK